MDKVVSMLPTFALVAAGALLIGPVLAGSATIGAQATSVAHGAGDVLTWAGKALH